MTNKLTLNPDFPLSDAEKLLIADLFLKAATDSAGAFITLRGEIFDVSEPVTFSVDNVTDLPALISSSAASVKAMTALSNSDVEKAAEEFDGDYKTELTALLQSRTPLKVVLDLPPKGALPRVKDVKKNSVAVVFTGPQTIATHLVRDTLVYPDEFNIIATTGSAKEGKGVIHEILLDAIEKLGVTAKDIMPNGFVIAISVRGPIAAERLSNGTTFCSGLYSICAYVPDPKQTP